MKLGETKYEILLIFKGLCNSNIRTYCWPSRAKILILLKKHYNKVICLRCLDQHLMELRDSGHINSYPQRGQKDDGTWYNKSSNRQLTRKAIFYLINRGVIFAKWLINWAKKGILPKLERKSHDLAKLYKQRESKQDSSSEELQAWLKTPGLKLARPRPAS